MHIKGFAQADSCASSTLSSLRLLRDHLLLRRRMLTCSDGENDFAADMTLARPCCIFNSPSASEPAVHTIERALANACDTALTLSFHTPEPPGTSLLQTHDVSFNVSQTNGTTLVIAPPPTHSISSTRIVRQPLPHALHSTRSARAHAWRTQRHTAA